MTPAPGAAPTSYEPDPEADPARLTYTFGGVEPVASLAPGSALSTWTLDCFGGRVRSASDVVSEVCDPAYLNPQTGPFFIEGAEPGDTLAVHFVSIEPRYAWGVSANIPLFGSLVATPTTAMLHAPLDERTWYYELDLDQRLVRYAALDSAFTLDLPLDPMHGTVGVAPPLGEARSSLAPGSWGGNMDTPEMRAGVTCYLGVNVEGAMFSLGDGHARQGEGETCGVAVETAMDTVVIVDVVKGVYTGWPRIESDTHLVSTGSTKPLEDAFRIAHGDLIAWLVEEFGFDRFDAYQLVTQISESPVANVCDPNYTFVAKAPKRYLPGSEVYASSRARLLEIANAYRG